MLIRHGTIRLARVAVPLVSLVSGAAAAAQDTADQPAFSLASSHFFTTTEGAAVYLSYRQLSYLDFRIYRVKDATKFFMDLRDPHVLGGPQPMVPQEETWIERISRWKASQRARVRSFVRSQLSSEYRAERRQQLDRQAVQLRRVVGAATFAQVTVRTIDYLGVARGGVSVRLVLERLARGRYGWDEDTRKVPSAESTLVTDAEGRWSFSRREYRDDRVVIFQQHFDDGRYEFTYLLKVTTPGEFRAMPARIAPMYVPGVTASTRLQRLTVRQNGSATGGAR